MHIGKDFFNDLIAFMTSGPSELFILRRKNGKDTLRGKFDTNIRCNAVHSLNSEENWVNRIIDKFKLDITTKKEEDLKKVPDTFSLPLAMFQVETLAR